MSTESLTQKIFMLGDDLDSNDWRIRGILEKAVQDDHIPALLLLKSKGADLKVRDEDGFTLLHRAAESGSELAADLLLDEGLDADDPCTFWERTPLHQAAEYGSLGVARLLVSSGARPNALDHWGRTPLHLAAKRGHCQVASYLLTHGAELNLKDDNGRTPLALAIKHGHNSVREMLSFRGGLL